LKQNAAGSVLQITLLVSLAKPRGKSTEKARVPIPRTATQASATRPTFTKPYLTAICSNAFQINKKCEKLKQFGVESFKIGVFPQARGSRPLFWRGCLCLQDGLPAAAKPRWSCGNEKKGRQSNCRPKLAF
jgi:hypothetical protein